MAIPYRLILFDCVNTLYVPDASRRPVLNIEGVEHVSTAPLLLERLTARLPGLDAVTLHRAQRASWRWAEAQRGEGHREIPATDRFRHLLGLLALPPDDALIAELMAVHYDAVVGSLGLPGEHLRLLDALRSEYRLALFSNFDHAPPLRARLERDGLAQWLRPVLISAELGWRKPGREAFRRALAAVGEAPDAILFVGDSYAEDALGAQDAGIDCAWIRLPDAPPPEGPQPRFELRAVTSLPVALAEAARPRRRMGG